MTLIDPAFDTSSPFFQAELGYVPCRDEDCELIACHPVHARPYPVAESAYDVQAHEPVVKQTKRLREVQAAEDLHTEAVAALAAAKIEPKLVHSTIAGAVVLIEWSCVHCDGKGWKVSPMVPCQLCTGRGVLLLNHSQMYLLLLKERKL